MFVVVPSKEFLKLDVWSEITTINLKLLHYFKFFINKFWFACMTKIQISFNVTDFDKN